MMIRISCLDTGVVNSRPRGGVGPLWVGSKHVEVDPCTVTDRRSLAANSANVDSELVFMQYDAISGTLITLDRERLL